MPSHKRSKLLAFELEHGGMIAIARNLTHCTLVLHGYVSAY
jgi:hypothetical protein